MSSSPFLTHRYALTLVLKRDKSQSRRKFFITTPLVAVAPARMCVRWNWWRVVVAAKRKTRNDSVLSQYINQTLAMFLISFQQLGARTARGRRNCRGRIWRGKCFVCVFLFAFLSLSLSHTLSLCLFFETSRNHFFFFDLRFFLYLVFIVVGGFRILRPASLYFYTRVNTHRSRTTVLSCDRCSCKWHGEKKSFFFYKTSRVLYYILINAERKLIWIDLLYFSRLKNVIFWSISSYSRLPKFCRLHYNNSEIR